VACGGEVASDARGASAIYTEHFTLVHIIRKVLLRVSSYLDYEGELAAGHERLRSG